MRNLKVNFRKMFSLRGVALGLALTSALSLTGCGKKADCDIHGLHAHRYENSTGYVRYIDKEYLEYEGYVRTDDYVAYENQDLMNFEKEKGLLKIEDNLKIIEENQPELHDFIEYEYSYTTFRPMMIGKVFPVMPVPNCDWTSDPNYAGLTGDQRLCRYVCTAYKVEIDEKGKYVLIPSPQVSDIREVMNEYPYMKKDYYKVVDVLYGNDLGYENGSAEDDLLYEEEAQSEKGRSLTKSRS